MKATSSPTRTEVIQQRQRQTLALQRELKECRTMLDSIAAMTGRDASKESIVASVRRVVEDRNYHRDITTALKTKIERLEAQIELGL